ncbi:MAG: hypothetical protein R2764_20345 [Bacteroidales bacterium]
MAVTNGSTYYVQVGGYNTSSGAGDLTIQFKFRDCEQGYLNELGHRF